MFTRDPRKGRTARWSRGDSWFGLKLVSLGLIAVWAAGCRGPAAQTQEPAAPTQTVAATSPAPAAQGGADAKLQPVAVPPYTGGPRLAVEKDVCDLGEIAVDSKQTGSFKFTNTGNEPLKIVAVVSCCGVVTKGVKPGQVYHPGQSGELQFECQAFTVPSANFAKILYLQTNDAQHKTVSLTIKAVVVRRVEAKPERLKLLLKGENAGNPELTLTSLDGRPFAITDVRSSGLTLTAEFDPAVKATRFVLKLKVDMAKLEHNMRGQISIDVTHPECRTVFLYYDTLAEFELSTSTIMVFGLKPGQTLQRELWVLNNYESDFEIESVSSVKGALKLLDKTKVDNRYQLQIEITPPARQRDETVTSDTLQIKIKGGRTLTIPFRGFYL
ncbi:MAG: DUF1573 domain-containing protein [Planctomycetes bacterium]|jgi:hypothetical protein|nr:DUF1573 domain-containing protein [Planctomycetota bacterium]